MVSTDMVAETKKDMWKLLKTLEVGKGQTMEIKINESEPEDSIDRWAMDTISTGKEVVDLPPHWHKNHQEHITVLEGRLEVTLGGEKSVVKAGDSPILVERRVVHSFKSFKGEKVIFREQPDPAGDYKALFFKDVFSKGGFGGVFHTLRAFYDGDSYLALPLGSRAVDQAFLAVFGGLAHAFGPRKPEKL
ncbi:hypothetical protein QQS21_012457 [Conoideocrella luteorostrata]|uniref:Cupin type-2 domain-containing protein n=1 Tax=Conoideocrella luteorostrata TaxID=1105319 RepID=A0AAJ0CFN8_9HYPO|nr:hypothetical protein QQS21_012457 [Conoideocrella luteorostrata]